MKTIEDHLLQRINNAALEMRLGKTLEEVRAYIEDQSSKEDFFKGLPNIDLRSLPQNSQKVIKACYDSLKKHSKEEHMDKFIALLLKVGDKSEVDIFIEWEYVLDEKFLQRLLHCGANPALIISYYGEYIVQSEHYITLRSMKYLSTLYKNHSDSFNEAFEKCEVNAKLCLAAFLAQVDSKKFRDYEQYTENSIKDSLKVLFSNSNISNDDINAAKKYLDGGLFVTDKIVDDLRKTINPIIIDGYILRLLLSLAYMIKDTSKVGKRFIKLSILLSYKEAFDSLNDFIKFDYNEDKNSLEVLKVIVKEESIPEELLIAWMGTGGNYGQYKYTKQLEKLAKVKKQAFERAIKLLNNIDSAYLSSILWGNEGGEEFLQHAEEKYIDEFLNYLSGQSIPNSLATEFAQYLKGERDFHSVKDKARNAMKNQSGYYYHYGTNHLDILFRLNKNSEVYVRAIKLIAAFYNYSLMSGVFHKYNNVPKDRNIKGFVEFLKGCSVGDEEILHYIVETAANSYSQQDIKEAKDAAINIVSEDRSLALSIIGSSSAQSRVILLEILFNDDKEAAIPVLIQYMEDTSKAVKETVVELLAKYPQCMPQVADQLSSKKQSVREMAVRVISLLKCEEAVKALKDAMEKEKSEKVKSLIAKALNLDEAATVSTEGVNMETYCRAILKRSSKAVLNWLDFSSLSKVKLRDSEKNAPDEMIMALLVAYASNGTIALNPEAKVIAAVLEEKDVSELALQVLMRWLEAGAEAKKKWVLAFSAVQGDYRVIEVLKKNIEQWPLNARGAIACEAVRALALNGSNTALMIVDGISRKFKFKQVKEAAASALSYAAEALGMEKEELSDKIVPTLGFDIRGERCFDYGGRIFTARLTPLLTLEVYDEDEKKLKSLPAAGKKDDADKVAAALEEFKSLKKLLKNTASIQNMRLELALSSNRLWSRENWTNLFVENPIMHQFAMGLIWGIYEHGKLKDTFRYMEDGTFNTKDEEEYEVPEAAQIGLVHPIELSEEEIQLWKEQLQNYEIKQPFEQISRTVFKVDHMDQSSKTVDRFAGTIINSLSLLGKLTSFGWYRGSVVDGGGYYSFYKEDKRLGIGVELEFSGTFIGMESEEVTVYELTFYKAGSIERGSYVYDTVKENNLIKPSQVPQRLYSEILYSVDRSLSSKIGVDSDWRKKK
jgi:hypothetical protein